MGVDYRVIVIGRCWNEKEYSIKGDFWCNRFREIWDDLEPAYNLNDEVTKIINDFSEKEWGSDVYKPESRIITLSSIKDYINEKKEALERTKKGLADLKEDRTKSQSDAAFEKFSELIGDAEQMVAYYQEECINYAQSLMDGIYFYINDVLDLTDDFYLSIWACW